jgi:hypothetical protein
MKEPGERRDPLDDKTHSSSIIHTAIAVPKPLFSPFKTALQPCGRVSQKALHMWHEPRQLCAVPCCA